MGVVREVCLLNGAFCTIMRPHHGQVLPACAGVTPQGVWGSRAIRREPRVRGDSGDGAMMRWISFSVIVRDC